MEERQGVTMDHPVTTDPSVVSVSVVESREEYSSLENPPTSTSVLAQFPPSHDSTFHFSTEGHFGAQYWVFSPPLDDPMPLESGITAPFWESSLGHIIFE